MLHEKPIEDSKDFLPQTMDFLPRTWVQVKHNT